MAKKIASPFNVGDLVYVHNAVFEGQRAGHSAEMKNYQGKSFVIERFVGGYEDNGAVRFTADSIHAKGCKGAWTWDVRCFRRLRKAKNVVQKKVETAKPVAVKPKAEKRDDYEDTVLTFRKEFAQNVANQRIGLCSFAQLVSKKIKDEHINAACHASVGRCYSYSARHEGVREINELILSIKGHIDQFPKGMQEDYKKNVEYILDRSPWRIAFVPEPMDVRWELGVRCNVNLPTEIVKAAAISLREMNEFSYRLPVFSRLVKEGHSENTAKLLAGCTRIVDQDKYVYSEFSNAHQIWWADFNAESLFTFFRKGFPEKSLNKPTMFSGNQGEYGVAITQASRVKKEGVTISSYIKERLFGKVVKPAAPVRWGDVAPAQHFTHAKLKELAAHLDTVLN